MQILVVVLDNLLDNFLDNPSGNFSDNPVFTELLTLFLWNVTLIPPSTSSILGMGSPAVSKPS
jgi:hypothetical protein